MQYQNKIRIVVADDQSLDLAGLIALLSNEPDIEVVGSESVATRVVPIVDRLQPDVLLLDLKWHGNETTGIGIIRKLRQKMPKLRIIAQSNYENLLIEAQESGADTAVAKSYTRGDLVALIKGVFNWVEIPREEPDTSERILLTYREKEILLKIADGETTNSIANALGISRNTIKRHVKSIFTKLEVVSRAEAINRAYQLGIIDVKLS